jgi:aldose 1-epimerase
MCAAACLTGSWVDAMATPWLAREPYGQMPDGTRIELFTLANPDGVVVRILTFGAIVASLEAPDRDGICRNVVLGHADLAGYVADTAHFGATIGRYANRIAGGRFSLDGVPYQLECNNPPNALHGGLRGFDKVVWSAEASAGTAAVTLRHRSVHGDQGYPGTLDVAMTYALSNDNVLSIDYAATTDRPTIVNLTNHSYFNLAGEGTSDVYGHELEIAADAFTPVDATLIPTGEMRAVSGTPFDFRAPLSIGARLRDADDQLQRGRGYDHNFVLRGTAGTLRAAARLRDPSSGRVLEISTTEPGIQVYSGNFLNGSLVGPSRRCYRQGDGLCLETQHFPDSPNQPNFPSTVLRPGHVFRSTTVWRFCTDVDGHPDRIGDQSSPDPARW